MGHGGTHHDHRLGFRASSDVLNGHAPEKSSPILARQNLEASAKFFGSTLQVGESQASSECLRQFDADTVISDLETHILGHTYGDDVPGRLGVLARIGQCFAEYSEETVGDALGDRVVDGTVEDHLGAISE